MDNIDSGASAQNVQSHVAPDEPLKSHSTTAHMSEPVQESSLEKVGAWLDNVHSIVIPRSADVVRPRKQLDVACTIEDLGRPGDERVKLPSQGLCDSGATGSCLDDAYARAQRLTRYPLKHPIQCYNADGSKNTAGLMTHYVIVALQIGSHHETIALPLGTFGPSVLILGHDWLTLHNPWIDWRKGTIRFGRSPECRVHLEYPEHHTWYGPHLALPEIIARFRAFIHICRLEKRFFERSTLRTGCPLKMTHGSNRV